MAGRGPVPVQEVRALKAILVGLCALVVATQAAAVASGGGTSGAGTERQQSLTLDARLEQKLAAERRWRSAVRSFESQRALQDSSAGRAVRSRALREARRRLARARREVAYYEELIRLRDARREARRLAKAPPRVAISEVFGSYAAQAVAVAWCESHLTTTARNGQYRGLFQMGSSERRLFGHGDTAHEQALAAHRYFVASGRDWSPWSCKWVAS